MAKRVVWKENDLVSIKLRDDLYTIGQMLSSPIMRFYDISNEHGQWENIDLNNYKILFRVFVGNAINRDLIHEKIKNLTVIANATSDDPCWIKPYNIIDIGHFKGHDKFPFFGGKLIERPIDGTLGAIDSPIIKEDLSPVADKEIIEKYELTNMWGDWDLRDRLIRYFDTGINRDDLKFYVFPDLWDDKEKLRPLTRRVPIPMR